MYVIHNKPPYSWTLSLAIYKMQVYPRCIFISGNSGRDQLKKGGHANVKVQEVVDHLASFLSDRKEISQSVIKPPTSSLRFGNLSTIIR